MGVSDTTEKDWEEHYKEYLASVTEEYKIGYNKGIGDFAEKLKENINYYDNDVYDSNDIINITLNEMGLSADNEIDS